MAKIKRLFVEENELETYLKNALKSIEKSQTKLFKVQPPIEFEIAVVNTKDKSGGIRVMIADANVKYKTESLSKIKISYRYS